jgi:hypothetical protein
MTLNILAYCDGFAQGIAGQWPQQV